jgi:hypothetical protein
MYFGEKDQNISSFSVKLFKSKRNHVYEIYSKNQLKMLPQTFIVKEFQTPNANREVEIIRHLQNQHIPVASVLLFDPPYLILKKIEGENLCDFINVPLLGTHSFNQVQVDLKEEIILGVNLLAKWFANLHRKNIIKEEEIETIIVLNKGDTRLRDFIINLSNNSIYGLDFEHAYEGDYLEDLCWICCSLIDTNPGIFELSKPSHKIKLINLFLKEYFRINKEFLFSFDRFANLLIENLNNVIRRRGLNLGDLNKKEILNRLYKKKN